MRSPNLKLNDAGGLDTTDKTGAKVGLAGTATLPAQMTPVQVFFHL